MTQKREEYIEFMNSNRVTEKQSYKVIYDKSVISEARLKQYEAEEVAAGSTLVGPHRDDFYVEYKSGRIEEYKDVSIYGSRGEQRMAVLWLKQGELNYLEQESGRVEEWKLPVLLLDDIFSELDHNHRKEIETEIENLIEEGGQVIMTTADEHLVPKDGWNIIKLPI
jgi:DNA replication and repair protein RecF